MFRCHSMSKSIKKSLISFRNRSWQGSLGPKVHWVWDLFFVFYIAFATLAVLNVITGVFCTFGLQKGHLI